MTRTCTAEKNKSRCTCSFGCGKAGICCECLNYHRSRAELPGCYFPKEAEAGGDRSVSNFIAVVERKGTSFLC